MKATSEKPGAITSGVEVSDIAPTGIWLLLDGREIFLAYEKFPWFRSGEVSKVFHVERPSPDHLWWPELDVDLHVESLEEPERFPLVSRTGP